MKAHMQRNSTGAACDGGPVVCYVPLGRHLVISKNVVRVVHCYKQRTT